MLQVPFCLYITKSQLLAVILQVISLSCRSFPLGMTEEQFLVWLYHKQINQETFSPLATPWKFLEWRYFREGWSIILEEVQGTHSHQLLHFPEWSACCCVCVLRLGIWGGLRTACLLGVPFNLYLINSSLSYIPTCHKSKAASSVKPSLIFSWQKHVLPFAVTCSLVCLALVYLSHALSSPLCMSREAFAMSFLYP